MDALKLLLSYPEAIAVFDPSLKVVFSNPAMNETLRVPAPGKDSRAEDIFVYSPETIDALKNFFSTGIGYFNHEFQLLTGNGEKTTVGLSINSINYGHKENGAVLIIRSNEGKKELHDAIEKEEKLAMLSLMAAGLAHEIQNPLGGIRGTAQLIGQNNKPLAEYCDLIIRETDRISSLVKELLNLRGERTPNWKVTNVHKVIDDTLLLMEPIFAGKALKIIRDFDPSLPNLQAEPDRLKQVFINLSKNSAEVMEKGGTLTVRTRASLMPSALAAGKRKKGMMMSVEFIDDGNGISPEVSKHLFTPFNTTKKKGTGLGLIVSLNIIRNHGGSLTLENNPSGKGATAKALIPLKYNA